MERGSEAVVVVLVRICGSVLAAWRDGGELRARCLRSDAPPCPYDQTEALALLRREE